MVKKSVKQGTPSKKKTTAKKEVRVAKEPEVVAAAEKTSDPSLVSDNSYPKKKTMPTILRLGLSVVFIGAMSALFTWLLFVRLENYDFEKVLTFINQKPYLYAYSNLVIFLVMMVIASLTWSVFFSTGVAFAILSVVTYISVTKLDLRGIPLLPEDLLLAGAAGEIMGFVDFWEIVRLVVGVILILIGSALLEYCTRRTVGRNTRKMAWWDKYSMVPRLSFGLIAVIALLFVINPLVEQDRNCSDWLEDVKLDIWKPLGAYDDNGFVIGFLYNLGKLNQVEPDDYSEAKMSEIAKKYQKIKAADTGREPLDKVVDNFVVILEETFYDPELFEKYAHTGGDVIPEVHKIFEEYPSGYMYSPEYGGGTANVEFEALTGLSNYWAKSYPYVNFLTKTENLISTASWAKTFDFDTLAIHSYDWSLYKRNVVLPKMGFDEMIDEDGMHFQEKEYFSEYVNDRSVFNEIVYALKQRDEKQMVAAMTMQNHMPYSAAHYPELSFYLKQPAQVTDDLQNSFQSIHVADSYIGEFLEELDDFDERTVVLLFGDHVAGIMPEYFNSEDPSEQNLARLTPYFIYTNFEIGKDDSNSLEDAVVGKVKKAEDTAKAREKNLELGFDLKTKGVDLSVTTPNCLLNEVYNILNAEKPALFYLLDAVCEETPILSSGYYVNVEESSEVLNDYKLVNYDILGGKHYWNGD